MIKHIYKYLSNIKTDLIVRKNDYITTEIADLKASFFIPTTQEYIWVNNIENEEGDIIRNVIGELEEYDVFWDVGANIGLYSCFVAQNKGVRAVAFEPYPPNIQKLKNNIELNSLSDDTTVVATALGAETGIATLNIAEDWDTKHSLVEEKGSDIQVGVFKGDDITKMTAIPDIVKIDVEGAELDVISGITQILKECRIIYCEVHKLFGISGQTVCQELEKMGFEVIVLNEDNKTVNLKAK